MPENAAVLTIEFKVNLLAPGKGERFLFRGSVTKPGRTIVVADGQAYAFAADGEAKLIATMTGHDDDSRRPGRRGRLSHGRAVQ